MFCTKFKLITLLRASYILCRFKQRCGSSRDETIRLPPSHERCKEIEDEVVAGGCVPPADNAQSFILQLPTVYSDSAGTAKKSE